MTDPDRSLRRYGEDEVARILKRATELHRDEPAARSLGSGMSLAELEEIAAEAGIDRSLVRRAARELDTRTESGGMSAKLLGSPLTVTLDRTLPGEIDDDAFEELVVAMQAHAGLHGQPSLLGRTLTWRAETQGRSRSTLVQVSSREGETRILIEERFHQLAGGLFGGIMGGGGGGLGIGVGVGVGVDVLGSVLFAVAFPLGIIGLSYLTARGIFGGIVRHRRKALGRLMESLTDIVTEAVRDGIEPPSDRTRLPGSP